MMYSILCIRLTKKQFRKWFSNYEYFNKKIIHYKLLRQNFDSVKMIFKGENDGENNS